MKTADLSEMLARGEGAVPAHAVASSYVMALLPALLLSLAGVIAVAGMRPDLVAAAASPMLWVKFAFPASLAGLGLAALIRLSRPGTRMGHGLAWLAVPFAVLVVLAIATLAAAPATAWRTLLLGETWRVCGLRIAIIALPSFVGAFLVLRRWAPTRPVLTGAVAGLVAGAMGAFAYAFHCPEMAPPFLAIWYSLGMLLPALLGALLGPRLLRW